MHPDFRAKKLSRELVAIRQALKAGERPEILIELIEKYGYDVVVSAFVSSTSTSIG